MSDLQSTEGEGKDEAPAKVSFSRLLALARPEWKRLAVATVFLVIGGAAGLAYPRFIGVLIDAAVDGGAEAINRTALIMAACLSWFREAVGGQIHWGRRRPEID